MSAKKADLRPRHCRYSAIHEGHEYERDVGGVTGLYWCDGVVHDHAQSCCTEHDHHTQPHKGCILR